MLRRHLMTHYGLTPEDYRAKWGLPADYPMVAPSYAEKRRVLAKEIGLGTKGRGGGRKPARTAAQPGVKRTCLPIRVAGRPMPGPRHTLLPFGFLSGPKSPFRPYYRRH